MQSPVFLFLFLMLAACGIRPGSVRKLENKRVTIIRSDRDFIGTRPSHGEDVQILYTGCGGILLTKGKQAILVDPFFSNQGLGRIARSLVFGSQALRHDKEQIRNGVAAIQNALARDSSELSCILVAHSHYDHLMDVPAVAGYFDDVPVLLNRTGYNICHNVLDTGRLILLEENMSTPEELNDPIVFSMRDSTSVRIYPIRSAHNPHFKYVKFFSGEHTESVQLFTKPLQRSDVNLWLEGTTFSFLVDFVGPEGSIEFRVFIQSSSCSAPSGLPRALPDNNAVDIAFLGVVSYHFSAGYPCALLEALAPREVVWVHWEDFFRKYGKNPKTVRGSDIPAFFELPCVNGYYIPGKLMWPLTTIRFTD